MIERGRACAAEEPAACAVRVGTRVRGGRTIGGDRRAFTLLEAVLALAILSAVLVSTLGLRARAAAATARLDQARMVTQAADEIFEMAVEGLLPTPEIEREARTRSWRGTHLGREYVLRAVPLERGSALPEDQRAGLSDRIIIYRYTLEYAGTETTFDWHR